MRRRAGKIVCMVLLGLRSGPQQNTVCCSSAASRRTATTFSAVGWLGLLAIPNNEATAMRAVHPRRYSCLDVHLPPRSLRLVDGASLVPARTAACIFLASLILSTLGLLKFWQSRFINA